MPSSVLNPIQLRCEYRQNPVGIDIPAPRLCWQLHCVDPWARNLRQTAFQIQAATSIEGLDATPDLWETGRVESAESLHHAYAGKPLPSLASVWWRVRVWDQDGQESAWSEAASFITGLMNSKEWSGRWIQEPARHDFDGCAWIWHPDDPEAHRGAKAGLCAFKVELPPSKSPIESTELFFAADDCAAVYADGKQLHSSLCREDTWRTPALVSVPWDVEDLRLLVMNKADGKPAGLAGKIIRRSADQTQQVLALQDSCRVARVDTEEEGLAGTPADWAAAVRLADVGQTDPGCNPLTIWGVPGREDGLTLPPAALFRKEVNISTPPRRAILAISARGICHPTINGKPLGKEFFAPGWHDYRKRSYYRLYDVTDLLRCGENALGIALADGWFAGYVAWGRTRNRYAGRRCFSAQLHIEQENGESMVVATDSSWTCSDEGPWQEADFLMGETFDARKLPTGWDEARFTAPAWKNAFYCADEPPVLQAHPGDPVTPQEHLEPIAITQPRPDCYVFDLGQNMVGVPQLRVTGPRGTRIQLRYSEVLQEDGTPYTQALRGARSTDVYIKATDQEEVWSPRFTFHGFRFVEATGLPVPPTKATLTGIVLNTDMERTGEFACSNETINRLFQNIVWGQKGNYLEVPTDCPQRDERAGWTGDAQIFIRTGSYNFQTGAFFTKWLRDLEDAQSSQGWFPAVAPYFNTAPNPDVCYMAWSDAGIICPYTVYQMYGDLQIINQRWASMTALMRYLEESSDGLIATDYGFGDWVSLNAHTPVDLVGTAYFALDALLMEEMARATGREEQATAYQDLFQRIRAAFQNKFITPDRRLAGNTQTAYVLALRLGLLPADMEPLAIDYLAQDLAYRGGHFSTGFVGLKDLMPTLSRFGRHDLAVRIIQKETFPSWGYEVRNGATTIWERWDGWNEEIGLQTWQMNSFNHYSFGAVGEWMYSYLAGIDQMEPGFRKLRLHPAPGEGLRYVRARYRSASGDIFSAWWRDGDAVRYDFTIPPNTTARIELPAKGYEVATEASPRDFTIHEVADAERKNGMVVFERGSGTYHFRVAPMQAP